MAHYTLIGGTSYEITGGKDLIGGTAYSKAKGRTLINGTGYDINFGSSVILNLAFQTYNQGWPSSPAHEILVNGESITLSTTANTGEIEVKSGDVITVRRKYYPNQTCAVSIYFNGSVVESIGNENTLYIPISSSSSLTSLEYQFVITSYTTITREDYTGPQMNMLSYYRMKITTS